MDKREVSPSLPGQGLCLVSSRGRNLKCRLRTLSHHLEALTEAAECAKELHQELGGVGHVYPLHRQGRLKVVCSWGTVAATSSRCNPTSGLISPHSTVAWV